MRDNVHYLHRQHRPNLYDQLAASHSHPVGNARNDLCESDSDPVWRAAAFGAILGFYFGLMVTAGAAWIWGLFL